MKSYPTAPQAFPYQGSKRKLASQIIPFIPIGTEKLVEPFAGSAALSVNALDCRVIKSSVISDINKPLMDLWKMIIENPSSLSEEYRELWNSQLNDPKNYFFEVRDTFNKTKNPSSLLYLLFRSSKSTIRYNKSGGYNQSPDNRRLGTSPDRVEKNLNRISQIMQGTEINNDSYERFLVGDKTFDPSDKNTVIYLDPPYQGTSGTKNTRYVSGLSRESLIESLEKAVTLDVAFILSYDAVTGDNIYGESLPEHLGMKRLDLVAGRSTHATLLGRNSETIESLYLSRELLHRLES